MPRATIEITTPAPTLAPPFTRTTRRELFGASAAMLLLGSAAAGAGKAAELDGELFARIDAWSARLRNVHAFPHAPDNSNWPEFDEVVELEDNAAREISNTPARTPEGLQAKARFVRAYMDEYGDDLDPVQAKARALLDDMLGEG